MHDNSSHISPTPKSLTIVVVGQHGAEHAPLTLQADETRSPMHALLRALGECTLLTFHGMCQRQRQRTSHYQCHITAQQRLQHPQVFATIAMHITVTGAHLVAPRLHHVMALLPKYCPVHATLSHTCTITHTLSLITKESL